MDLLPKVTPKELIEILDNELSSSHPRSFFLWGPPGVGKSQIVRDMAKKHGRPLYDLRLVNYSPEDLKGIPFKKDEGVVWAKPTNLPNSDEKAVLFLDEITTAPEAIQAAAYQIALDKRVGPHLFHPDTMVIAASNRVEDNSLVYLPPRALLLRFTQFEITVDYDSFEEWAITNGIHPIVIAFLKTNPALLYQAAEMVHPTPRGWECVSRQVYLWEQKGKYVPIAVVHGIVGGPAAKQFDAYIRIFKDMPSIMDIIRKKVKVSELPKMDIHKWIFLLVNLIYVFKAEEMEHREALVQLLDAVPDEYGKELGIFTLSALVRRESIKTPALLTNILRKLKRGDEINQYLNL